MGLTCPKCKREMKSKSGYTLHVKKCCPEVATQLGPEDNLGYCEKLVAEIQEILGCDEATYRLEKGLRPGQYQLKCQEGRLIRHFGGAMAPSRLVLLLQGFVDALKEHDLWMRGYIRPPMVAGRG
jgi:hypothetical protein